MYQIRPETPADQPEVEALYDLCFAPGRTALSSYRLRDGVAPVRDLCLVLRDPGGAVLAAIRFWPVRIAAQPVLLLGPIAVHPTAQGEGLGGLLMRESLGRAAAGGWERVLLVGDAPYYQRFGFQRMEGVEMPPPTNPDRVLGLELRPGAWEGVTGLVERDVAGLSQTDGRPHIQPVDADRLLEGDADDRDATDDPAPDQGRVDP